MYGGENSGMPLGPDPVNNGTGTFGADDNYDQPAAIVSGGDDGGAVAFDSNNNKSNNNSAKFFGHRSRESATRADAAQAQANAELAAASSIASNPNNPEFFRQAAVDNTTSKIQRQPRQINKKPFIIGGIVLLVGAAITCLIIFVMPLLFRPYPNGMTNESIAEILTDENIDIISNLEQGMKKSSTSPQYLNAGLHNSKINTTELIAGLRSQLDVYQKVYDAISKYEAVQYRSDTVEYFNNAKEKMGRMLPIYKGIIDRTELVYGFVFDGAGVDTISSLPGYEKSIQNDLNNYNRLAKLDNQYKSMKCTLDQANTVGTTCYNLSEEIYNLEESLSAGTYDLRKIIFGNDIGSVNTKANFVRRDLRSIQYAPENKTLEDESDE